MARFTLAALCFASLIQNAFGQDAIGPKSVLWSTLVEVAEAKQIDFAKTMRKSILKMAKKKPGVAVTNRGGWQSAHQLLEQDEVSLEGVTAARAQIHAAIEAYVEKTGSLHSLNKKPFGGEILVEITDSWANVNKVGTDFNIPHSHPNDDIAGALYLNCPEQPCTLTFEDPTYLKRDLGIHQVHMNNGSVAIFPAWLNHYVPIHPGKPETKPRVTLSFNAKMKNWKPGPPPVRVVFKSPAHYDEQNHGKAAVVPSFTSLWPSILLKEEPMDVTTNISEAGARAHAKKVVEKYVSLSQEDKGFVHLDFSRVDQAAPMLRNPHWSAGHDVVGVVCIRAGSGPYTIDFEDPRNSASMHFGSLATRLVAPAHMRAAFQWGGIEPPVFGQSLTKAGQALAFPARLKHWVTVPADGEFLYFSGSSSEQASQEEAMKLACAATGSNAGICTPEE